MMGKKVPTSKLFYQFSLETRVPENHLLRRVATAVDFSFVPRLTARLYSDMGQPSIDPIVLFKIALLGYMYGISSERRLVQDINLNLAYLWFIGYDIDEVVPDHSALSKVRRRFGPAIYLAFFANIVRQCEKAGLVKGDKIYVDSTLVGADANRDSVVSRALLGQLADAEDYVRSLWQDNPEALGADEASAPAPRLLHPDLPVAAPSDAPAGTEAPPAIVAPTTPAQPSSEPPVEPPSRMERAGASEKRRLHVAGKGDVPNKVTARLYERMVSRVDPEAEVVQRARVLGGLYYKVHAAVDAGRARIITAVEASGGAVADEFLLERLIREHEGNVGRGVGVVVADSKYGTVDNYKRLEVLGIRGAIPMRESNAEGRAVPPSIFTYDKASDSFLCPEGKRLTRRCITKTSAGHPNVTYRAKKEDCSSCPCKEGCCEKARSRQVSRPADDGLCERTAAYLATPEARQNIRRRKAWIEMIFGDGKERRGLRRAHFRGLDWMQIQALMTAISQNIRKLAMRKGRRPEHGTGTLEKGIPVAIVRLLPFYRSANVTENRDLTIRLFLN